MVFKLRFNEPMILLGVNMHMVTAESGEYMSIHMEDDCAKFRDYLSWCLSTCKHMYGNLSKVVQNKL